MTSEKKEEVVALLGIFAFVVGFIVAEFLIYYNPEARADWTRMLICAIISPFMFAPAFVGVIAGIISLVLLPAYFIKAIRYGDFEKLGTACILAGIGLIGGGGTVARWVKYIVIDNYPAFGYNPDNVYAVTGINTIVSLPILIGIGSITGFLILGLLFCIAAGIRAVVSRL